MVTTKESTAQRLGRLLRQRGWATEEQLERARRIHESAGGSFGTCLLEVGALSEHKLLEALSLLLKVPPAENRDLLDIAPAVAGQISERLARNAQVVPFRIVGGELWVAMVEPDQLALQDEIAFACSHRLRVHVASEPRVAAALARLHGGQLPARLASLLERLEGGAAFRQRQAAEPPAALAFERPARVAAQGSSRPAPAPSPPAGESAPPRPRAERPRTPPTIPLTAEERARLTGRTPRSPRPVISLQEAERSLGAANEIDAIGTTLLDFFGPQFRHTVLLQVQSRRVHGWMGRGPDLDEVALRRFAVSLNEPSVFLNLHLGSAFHVGALPAMPAHRLLTACWDGSPQNPTVALPLRVRGRLVAVMVAERGGAGVQDLDLDALQQVTQRASSALELYLMRKKLRKV